MGSSAPGSSAAWRPVRRTACPAGVVRVLKHLFFFLESERGSGVFGSSGSLAFAFLACGKNGPAILIQIQIFKQLS